MLTNRIRLRPINKSDSSLLYNWITDRSLVLYNSSFYPVTEKDHEAWIKRMMTKRQDLVIFIVEELKTGCAIGSCQLFNINWIHRNAELQIRIGENSYLNKGFGSEAVRLLTTFGFNDLNLHRIYLHVFSSNERAIVAYKKCGFNMEGVLKEAAFIDGNWIDILLMAQLSSRSYV